MFTYVVTGNMGELVMPPAAEVARAGELWLHTCFEAFLRTSPDASNGYYEFNFAPSRQWAAYRFSGYRTGMCVAAEIGAPLIAVEASPDRYLLRASLDLGQLQTPSANREGSEHDGAWHLGLSAIIEASGGDRSYWALAHPLGKPDFHHPDCFALEVR